MLWPNPISKCYTSVQRRNKIVAVRDRSGIGVEFKKNAYGLEERHTISNCNAWFNSSLVAFNLCCRRGGGWEKTGAGLISIKHLIEWVGTTSAKSKLINSGKECRSDWYGPSEAPIKETALIAGFDCLRPDTERSMFASNKWRSPISVRRSNKSALGIGYGSSAPMKIYANSVRKSRFKEQEIWL